MTIEEKVSKLRQKRGMYTGIIKRWEKKIDVLEDAVLHATPHSRGALEKELVYYHEKIKVIMDALYLIDNTLSGYWYLERRMYSNEMDKEMFEQKAKKLLGIDEVAPWEVDAEVPDGKEESDEYTG